jgi:alkylation response protein AidB-like acyl-CoA dehydrogenase
VGVDFELDDEQGMIRDLVARFAADQADFGDRRRQRAEPQGFDAANWRMLGELGLLALPFGAEAGGMGGGPVELITVMEGFGRGLCVEPYLSDLLLAGRLLERAGSAAQRERWLPGIVAGERRLVLAHMERAARFDPLFVQCRAQGTGAAATLRGTKTFVLAGEGAAGFVVSAREDGADGLSLWLVAADAAGLARHAYRLVDGSVALELQLHDVAAERLDGGAEALLACFEEARLAACAEMVGIMATMFDATLEHLRTRRQFGQSIGSFQGIQHRMADQYAALEQSRSWMLRAALMPQDPAAVAGAKAYIGAAAVKLAEECVQFHGGMGVSDELALGHGHKRILLLATLLGDSDSELKRYVAASGRA